MRNFIEAILVMAVLLCATATCQANDVKYCKDARTGKIIVVEAGMPCPYPTHEL